MELTPLKLHRENKPLPPLEPTREEVRTRACIPVTKSGVGQPRAAVLALICHYWETLGKPLDLLELLLPPLQEGKAAVEAVALNNMRNCEKDKGITKVKKRKISIYKQESSIMGILKWCDHIVHFKRYPSLFGRHCTI